MGTALFVGIVIGAGIPGLLFGIYFYGRWMYGEKWYLAFGRNSVLGDDDPVAKEIEEAEFTRLNLK